MQIGGDSSKDAIYQTLSQVIKDKCARKYTWKGIRKSSKPGAVNLRFINIIRGYVVYNNFIFMVHCKHLLLYQVILTLQKRYVQFMLT